MANFSKIKGRQLLDFVRKNNKDKIAVLIELDLPRAKIRIQREAGDRTPGRGYKIAGIDAVDPATDAESQLKIEEMRELLRKMGCAAPLWLDLSKAFSVELGTNDISFLTASSLVKQILPNETRSLLR